jgi:hypothetical protein
LDVITKNFTMTLGSSFAQAFSSFTASSHVDLLLLVELFSRRKLKLE